MGTLCPKVKHRSFLADIVKEMSEGEIEEMKFLVGNELSVQAREKVTRLQFLEILGHLGYWSTGEDGRVQWSKFADLCGCIKRYDLKQSLMQYESQFGGCVAVSSNSPIVMATDAVADGILAPTETMPLIPNSLKTHSKPGCTALLYVFWRTLIAKK